MGRRTKSLRLKPLRNGMPLELDYGIDTPFWYVPIDFGRKNAPPPSYPLA